MMRALRTAVVLAGATVLLAVGISPASADTVTSTISGGSLSATTFGAALTGVTLNGTNTQTATGTAAQWSLLDARGTGAAWTVSVTATVPTSAAGTVETTARTIPVTNLTITPGTITAGTGSDSAANITAGALAMSGSSQALISAAGPDKGTYTLTPSFSLLIPANAYRSNYSLVVGSSALNPYSSTVTYTIA